MDRNKAISFMHDLLRMMVSKDGSDLFITTGDESRRQSNDCFQAKPFA